MRTSRIPYVLSAMALAVGVLLASDGLARWLPKWIQPQLDQGWATLLAGLLALGAGALAYVGAMASVEQGRERARQDDQRRRLNIYLKAEHMAYNLLEVAPLGHFAARLTFSKVTVEGKHALGTVPASEVSIPRPAQLDELWANLSDFPPEAIQEIRSITRNFDAIESYLDRVKDVPDGMESPIATKYFAIRDSAFVLGRIMSRYTDDHCWEIEDRSCLIYGDPNDDDRHNGLDAGPPLATALESPHETTPPHRTHALGLHLGARAQGDLRYGGDGFRPAAVVSYGRGVAD